MYEFWKVFKRNPTTYNPRLFGTIFLGYFAFSITRQKLTLWNNDYVSLYFFIYCLKKKYNKDCGT